MKEAQFQMVRENIRIFFFGMIFMPYLFTTREMWRRSGQKFWKLGNMSSDHNLLYQTYRVTTIHFSGEGHFHEYVNPFWLSVRPFYGEVNIFAVIILQTELRLFADILPNRTTPENLVSTKPQNYSARVAYLHSGVLILSLLAFTSRDLPETGRATLEPSVKLSLGEPSTGTSQMRLSLRETVNKVAEVRISFRKVKAICLKQRVQHCLAVRQHCLSHDRLTDNTCCWSFFKEFSHGWFWVILTTYKITYKIEQKMNIRVVY